LNKTPDIASRKTFDRSPEVCEEKFVQHKKRDELKYKKSRSKSMSGKGKCWVVLMKVYKINVMLPNPMTTIK
jgi:hypothetical protein